MAAQEEVQQPNDNDMPGTRTPAAGIRMNEDSGGDSESPVPDYCKEEDNDSSSSNDGSHHSSRFNRPTTTIAVAASNNKPLNPTWSHLTERFVHRQIPKGITKVALTAARRPILCVGSMALVSVALLLVGFATNFQLHVEEFEVFSPFGVRPREHRTWVERDSGFPKDDRLLAQLVHAKGENVLSVEGIRRAFDAYQVVHGLPGYSELCVHSDYYKNGNGNNGTRTCQVSSPLRFWNFSRAVFEATVVSNDNSNSSGSDSDSDQRVREIVSASTYPDGTPVDTDAILGNPVRSNQNNTLEAQGLTTTFVLPDVDEMVMDFETLALEQVLSLQEQWKHQQDDHNDDTLTFHLEVLSERSYPDEFQRAIVQDLPLIPMVFLLMTIFTCIIFGRQQWPLGLGAVITIVGSLMTGYGLMFVCGVPFTNMTPLVPFVVFGVGLDDTFLIVGAFARTRGNSVEQRIQQTMNDIGLSILVTTLTTAVAFGLGSISSIPAVRWLCLYSMTTIVIDFFYQITFFIALLTLVEERRNRRNICVCLSGAADAGAGAGADEIEQQQEHQQQRQHYGQTRSSFVGRFAAWYAEQLLKPVVKIVVIIAFTALCGVCAYSASQLRQEFKVTEFLPSGSYATSFLNAFERYSSRSLPIYAYFRNVDQSDEDVQLRMVEYMDELAALDQFGDEPPFCWIRDFREFQNTEDGTWFGNANLTFIDQVKVLLTDPTVKEVYGDNIVFNDNGDEIVASRCVLYAEKLNLDVVQEQIDLLHAQRDVTASQPVNKGTSDWSFFTYDIFYLTWEFYDAIVGEWLLTTIFGLIAVTTVGFVCLPHWSASFFVLPMIAVLYVDLVGVIQFSGLYINVVTHVALAMSIGLLVDYVVHILLRYYESPGLTRDEKVKEMLRTIGSAVLSGGLSTFLGVLPLAFSTSEVMRTVFICFVSMVSLGCGHGLILLPVLLSYVGPINNPTSTLTPTSQT